MVKNLPASAENTRGAGSVPEPEDPREEEVAAPSSTLALRIPGTEQPGGQQSVSERVSE